MSYKKETLFTLNAIHYDDGQTLYTLGNEREDGTSWSSGMFNEIDLVIEVLKQIGKIEESAKVFVSNDCPTNTNHGMPHPWGNPEAVYPTTTDNHL